MGKMDEGFRNLSMLENQAQQYNNTSQSGTGRGYRGVEKKKKDIEMPLTGLILIPSTALSGLSGQASNSDAEKTAKNKMV